MDVNARTVLRWSSRMKTKRNHRGQHWRLKGPFGFGSHWLSSGFPQQEHGCLDGLWHFPHLQGNPEPGAHSQAAIRPSDHLGCGAHFLGDQRKPALHSGFLPLLSSFLRLQAPHAQEQTGRHQAQQLGACSTAGPCESPGPQLARLSGTQSPSCRFTPSHPLVATLFPNTPQSGLSNRKAHIIKFLFFSRSPKNISRL